MKKIITSIFLVTSGLLIQSCAVNPVTGKRQVALISESQEIQMGKEADPQIIAEYGLYNDKELQSFIQQKGKEMAGISHRPNLNYEFKIVDSDVLNAFAVPGGYVYFTRGIMAHFNNEAEFAGVLGHELGHITARHTVSQQSKAILGQIGLIGGMILSPTLAQFGEQASQGLGLLFLKFGRDAERESDQLGVEYSSKIGYDAKEMADFFNTLERKSSSVGSDPIPDFLSTHPNPGSRNVAVAKAADEWKTKLNLANAKIERNNYLRRIDGLIYGEDPKGGYLENDVFYHPELKFQYNKPANWTYHNSPQSVQMGARDGKAALILSGIPGSSLQDAANNMVKQNGLQVLDSKQENLNGIPAMAILAQQVQQNQQTGQSQVTIKVICYVIQLGNTYFNLAGLSTPANFNNYYNTFLASIKSFRKITDNTKLTKKPERVRIKTLTQNATLQQALLKYNTPQKRLEELAILNGMKLNDMVEKGTSIKVIEE